MMKKSTPVTRNGFRSAFFACMLLLFAAGFQKLNAQTVTITADINWTCYSEENWVYIYTPDLSSYVYFCDPNHCYYRDNTNYAYVASNVNLGTLPYQCGQYLVRMYDAWPDNWNCGTGVTIKLNGVSVGTFNKLNGTAAYQDAYFFPPAIDQGFLNLSAAGAAGGVPSGCTATTMTITTAIMGSS